MFTIANTDTFLKTKKHINTILHKMIGADNLLCTFAILRKTFGHDGCVTADGKNKYHSAAVTNFTCILCSAQVTAERQAETTIRYNIFMSSNFMSCKFDSPSFSFSVNTNLHALEVVTLLAILAIKFVFSLQWCFAITAALPAHLTLCTAANVGDRPRQPAYEIKLMLSRVSWALAQISCIRCLGQNYFAIGPKPTVVDGMMFLTHTVMQGYIRFEWVAKLFPADLRREIRDLEKQIHELSATRSHRRTTESAGTGRFDTLVDTDNSPYRQGTAFAGLPNVGDISYSGGDGDVSCHVPISHDSALQHRRTERQTDMQADRLN